MNSGQRGRVYRTPVLAAGFGGGADGAMAADCCPFSLAASIVVKAMARFR
jgi:hypothetical protein